MIEKCHINKWPKSMNDKLKFGSEFAIVGNHIASNDTNEQGFKKHLKPQGKKPGGIIDIQKPLLISKIALICPKCNQQTKILNHELLDRTSPPVVLVAPDLSERNMHQLVQDVLADIEI